MQLSPLLLVLFSFNLPTQPVIIPQPAYLENVQKAGLDFIWPTNASHELSSTFAEFRATHFHYGIDIKTWNQVGYDVYSSEDGYISRIRVSPTGYGKVLYITHKGGYVTVYAHLDGFAGKVKNFVLGKHYELMRNELNIFLNPKDLPVKKGELVAFTGETGIGTPHLHFEIRDPSGNELNPLRLQKGQFQDLTPPTITGFAVKPLTLYGKVNNTFEPVIYKEFKRSGNASLELTEIPVISENAGFLIDGYDLSSGKSNKYGFHQIQLWIDGSMHYQITYDQFPVEEARYILVDRDPELLRDGYGRFTRLFESEPNPLSIYNKVTDKAGKINGLLPGIHTGKVVVTDLMGNQTELLFKFEFTEEKNRFESQFLAVKERKNFSVHAFPANFPADVSPLIWYPVTGGSGNPSKSDIDTVFINRENNLLRITLRGKSLVKRDFRIALTQASESLLPVQVTSGKQSVFIDFQVQGLPAIQNFNFYMMDFNDKILVEKKWNLVYVNNTAPITVQLPSGNEAQFNPGNLFQPQWMSFSETENSAEFLNYRLELGSGALPFYSSAGLKFRKPRAMNPGFGLYRFSGKSSSFIGNKTEDEYFVSDILSPGVYGFDVDTLPPILIQKSGSGNRITGKKIEFKIKDAGSGLNTSSAKVLINSQWCLAEFDPEKALLKVYTDRVKPATDYEVVVFLEDRTGNQTTETFYWKGR